MDRLILSGITPGLNGSIRTKILPGIGELGNPPGGFGNQLDISNFTFANNFALNVLKQLNNSNNE